MELIKENSNKHGTVEAVLSSLAVEWRGSAKPVQSDTQKQSGSLVPCHGFANLDTMEKFLSRLENLATSLSESDPDVETKLKEAERKFAEVLGSVQSLGVALKQSMAQVKSTQSQVQKRLDQQKRKEEKQLQSSEEKRRKTQEAQKRQQQNQEAVHQAGQVQAQAVAECKGHSVFSLDLARLGHTPMLSVQASGLSKMTKLNGPYIVKDVTSLAKGADKTEELVRLDAFSKGFQDSDTFKKTGRTLRKFALSNSFNDAVMKETIPSNMSNSELWGRHVPKETFEPMARLAVGWRVMAMRR